MIVSGGAALDFAPQALGETIPSLSNGYFYANDGLTLSGKFATYAALYRAQPSVATLVDKIANSAARLTLKVWDNTPKTGKVQDADSAFAKLMARPCAIMSPFNFWRWTISTYEVYGEAFWYKVRSGKDADRNPSGPVISLLPMHPSRTSVKRDEQGQVWYVFSLGVASAGLLTAPAEDVVPFQRYNPDSLMRGLSRLEPLRSTLLNEDAARRATQSWWKNGARPSVILKHPMELSDGAHRRIKEGFFNANAGADNMGAAAVLEEGMDATVVQLTADEMQYIESRKMNLQEVCMVYDVPPPVVHILDHATFSNITEQMRSMYRDTMAPRLEDVESVIDFHLRSEFFTTPTHMATFALDEVLRGDFETRAESVQKLIQSGVMKPSEARPLFDLPDAGELSDHLYANAALVPLGSSVHGQQDVSTTGELIPSPMPMGAPKPPSKALDMRSIAGRVGQKSTLTDKRAALVEEHRKALGDHLANQKAAAFAGNPVDTAAFDDALAGILTGLAEATAKAIGSAVAKQLGGAAYDVADIATWIADNGITSAKAINATTAAELKAFLERPDATAADYFDGPAQSRADTIAASRVLMVGGLASLSSASQTGAATKTWITGPSARASHAQMSGETVGIDELFSNGMNMPGDPAGGADEVAGCNCSVEFDF